MPGTETYTQKQPIYILSNMSITYDIFMPSEGNPIHTPFMWDFSFHGDEDIITGFLGYNTMLTCKWIPEIWRNIDGSSKFPRNTGIYQLVNTITTQNNIMLFNFL